MSAPKQTNQSLRDLLELTRPIWHWAPLMVIILIGNAVFSSFSVLMILPVLEYLMNVEGLSEGSAMPEEASALLKGVLDFVNWLGFDHPFVGICAVVLFALLCKASFSILSAYANVAFSEQIRLYWVHKLARLYLNAPYASVIAKKHGVIANDIIREPTEAARFVKTFLQFMTNAAIAAFLIASMAAASWEVVAVFLLFAFLMVIVTRKALFGFSATLGQRSLRLTQEIVGAVHETVVAMKELRIQVAEKHREKYLMEIMRRLGRNQVAFQVLRELPRSLGEFLVVSAGIALVIAAYFMLDGKLDGILPTLAFFAVAISRLVNMISELVSQRIYYINKLPSVRSVLQIARDPLFSAAHAESPSEDSLLTTSGDIVFQDVSFSYRGGAEALKNVTCVFPAGKVTVLLGGSGAGKSTIVDLLARIYAPDRGYITCNGEDISTFPVSFWRKRLGYVSQDPVLFNGTIRENVDMGRSVDARTLAEAADIAGLTSFMGTGSRGWSATLGPQGLSLSGGQRKRIAIARALAGKPDIVVFDETTSAIEEKMEREILEKIRNRRVDTTVIMITHRITSAYLADHVVVLEKGKVVASGTYDEVRPAAERLITTESAA